MNYLLDSIDLLNKYRNNLILSAVIIGALIVLLRYFRSKDYHVTLIVLEKEMNKHYSKRFKELYSENNIQEYPIKPDKLYEMPVKILDYYRGIRKRYLQINKIDEKKPLSYTVPQVQPKILEIVRKSKALQKVGEKEFSETWSLPNKRKIFIFIAAVVIAYFVYKYVMGGSVNIGF